MMKLQSMLLQMQRAQFARLHRSNGSTVFACAVGNNHPSSQHMLQCARGVSSALTLQIKNYPGSRVLNMLPMLDISINGDASPNTIPGTVVRSHINRNLLESISRQLEIYDDNSTVAAVMFTSESSEVFAGGLDFARESGDQEEQQQLLRAANSLCKQLSSSKKATVAVLSGELEGSVYSIFAGCDYLLGTELTSFRISQLMRGALPLGGALARRLAQTSPHGSAVARYLAVSGRCLNARDMLSLGMLSHIVEQEPHETIAAALANTIAPDDSRKAVQSCQVDVEALPQLLDAMHIFTSDIDTDNTITIATDANAPQQQRQQQQHVLDGLLDHPAWQEIMLVPPQLQHVDSLFQHLPQYVSDSDSSDGNATATAASADFEDSEEFADILESISRCFAASEPADCRAALAALAAADPPQRWAAAALRNWDENVSDAALVAKWFQLTQVVATKATKQTRRSPQLQSRGNSSSSTNNNGRNSRKDVTDSAFEEEEKVLSM